MHVERALSEAYANHRFLRDRTKLRVDWVWTQGHGGVRELRGPEMRQQGSCGLWDAILKLHDLENRVSHYKIKSKNSAHIIKSAGVEDRQAW